MPFVNIKTPEAALSAGQKAEIGHRVTEVKDGGYYRADETFILPDAYRAR
jgi:4-oxalocrotonate tautomerase